MKPAAGYFILLFARRCLPLRLFAGGPVFRVLAADPEAVDFTFPGNSALEEFFDGFGFFARDGESAAALEELCKILQFFAYRIRRQ